MLRQQIQEGGLSGDLPGCDQLAGEFNVGNKTVIAAVQQLKKEVWLIAQDAGALAGARLRASSSPTINAWLRTNSSPTVVD